MPGRRGSNSSVQDWLDGQYEYVGPDYETVRNPEPPQVSRHPPEPSTGGRYGRIGRDGFREVPPDGSDTSSAGRVRPRDRYRPPTPPRETFDRPRHTYRHERDYDRERYQPREWEANRDERRERRPSPRRRDTRHPPPSRHGRPFERPPLATATTAPPITKRDESPYRQRRHRTPSPTRYRPSKHHESPPPASASIRRSKSTKEPTRPPITRSKTTKDKSMAFLGNPLVQKAAAAALEAGATTAFGLRGQKGQWGGEKGARVATAALGAAALDALRKNEGAKSKTVPTESRPTSSKSASAGGVEMFGNAVGGYIADQFARRRSQRKTRH